MRNAESEARDHQLPTIGSNTPHSALRIPHSSDIPHSALRTSHSGGTPHSVGVLAVQGDFEAHAKALRNAGATAVLIKHPAQLAAIDALVLPGGESTTVRKFLLENEFAGSIRALAGRGCPILGTCAGAILLAREVSNNVSSGVVVADTPGLGLMDLAICRNAYGRQLSSFITRQAVPAFPGDPLEMVFIRAPLIERVGAGVRVLAEHNGSPVIAQQGRLLAVTFHPELTEDLRVHEYFLGMIG